MNRPVSKRDAILDVAEALVRRVGYNGFSTRDVADLVGIKAASVHYHFPTKADLGEAVTHRYTDRFVAGLGPPDRWVGDAPGAARHFADAFRRALTEDGKLCLCAVLGAETGGVPDTVARATRAFFDGNLAWLSDAMRGRARGDETAALILATVEGAMIVGNSLEDIGRFDAAVAMLIDALAAGVGSNSPKAESVAPAAWMRAWRT